MLIFAGLLAATTVLLLAPAYAVLEERFRYYILGVATATAPGVDPAVGGSPLCLRTKTELGAGALVVVVLLFPLLLALYLAGMLVKALLRVRLA